VCCGVIGPYIILQRLTGDIYAVLQDELPALRESSSTNMTDVLPA